MSTPTIDKTEIPRGPHAAHDTDPADKPGDRTITAIWHLDEPDAEGYQHQAVLATTHDTGHGYTSRLHPGYIRRADGLVRIILDAQTITCTTIHQETGKPRFHRATLAKVHHAALAELRRRYDTDATDDPDIRAVFDAGSYRHTHRPAPHSRVNTPVHVYRGREQDRP